MTEIDESWARVCMGDQRSFGDWMGRVERPIRRALAPWARMIDPEVVVQEACFRMWVRANDHGVEPLVGDDASLRFAIVLARNLARNEARKHGLEMEGQGDQSFDPPAEPEELPDPLLRRVLRECLEKLARRPLDALLSRLGDGPAMPDKSLAESLGMSLNAFLQNIVRARKQLRSCLEGKGISMAEFGR